MVLFGADKSLAEKKAVSLETYVNQELHEYSRKDYLADQDHRLNYSAADMIHAGVAVEPGSGQRDVKLCGGNPVLWRE